MNCIQFYLAVVDFNHKDSLRYMLSKVCRSLRSFSNELLTDHGIYAGQDSILCSLNNRDSIAQSKIVDELGVQPATITKMVSRLQNSGYVIREKDKIDSRVSNISLTSKGVTIQESIILTLDQIEGIVFNNFTVAEKMLFNRLLQQIISNIDEERSEMNKISIGLES